MAQAWSVRRLTEADLPRLWEWLNRPHVAARWGGPVALDRVQAKYRPRLLTGILSIAFLLAPPAGQTQPVLEELRFNPPRVCPRDTFQWSVSYRGLPGGLAAVQDIVMEGRWDGLGERSFRSVLTPTKEDLQAHSADQGRFESRLTHAGPAPKGPPSGSDKMGFSKGGVVALYSALTRFQRLYGPAGARFAHHIAFYPACYFTFVGDDKVSDRPIRIFQGTADDLAPIEPCRAYVERLRGAGADARLTEYAGALHGFDRPGDRPARHNPREQNGSRCFWEERPEGHLVSRASGQPFSLSDPCVVLGGTAGSDPVAYRAARDAVQALTAPKTSASQ